MDQDHRSQALKDLGVRTWRGAAVLGLQFFALLLTVLVAMKLIGPMLGIVSFVDKSWLFILLSPLASAFGLFVAVALIAEAQRLASK